MPATQTNKATLAEMVDMNVENSNEAVDVSIVSSWMTKLDKVMEALGHPNLPIFEVRAICDVLIETMDEIYQSVPISLSSSYIHEVQVEFIRVTIVATRVLLMMAAEYKVGDGMSEMDEEFYLMTELKSRTILQGFSSVSKLSFSKYPLVRECLDIQNSCPDSVILEDRLVFKIPRYLPTEKFDREGTEYMYVENNRDNDIDLTDIASQEMELLDIALSSAYDYLDENDANDTSKVYNSSHKPIHSKRENSHEVNSNARCSYNDTCTHYEGWLVLSSMTRLSQETSTFEQHLPQRLFMKLFRDGTMKCSDDKNANPSLIFGFGKPSYCEPILSPGSLFKFRIRGSYVISMSSEHEHIDMESKIAYIEAVQLVVEVDEKSGGNFVDGARWIEKLQEVFSIVSKKFDVQDGIQKAWNDKRLWEASAMLSLQSYLAGETSENIARQLLTIKLS